MIEELSGEQTCHPERQRRIWAPESKVVSIAVLTSHTEAGCFTSFSMTDV